MAVLVDSGIWIAAYNNRDSQHANATELLAKAENPYITDFILDEVVSFLTGSRALKKVPAEKRMENARGFLRFVQKSGAVDLVRVSEVDFGRAKTSYENQPFILTLTDWTSVFTMKTLGIQTLLTYDREFIRLRRNEDYNFLEIRGCRNKA
jgi:predicted nucleic acid-binding protein